MISPRCETYCTATLRQSRRFAGNGMASEDFGERRKSAEASARIRLSALAPSSGQTDNQNRNERNSFRRPFTCRVRSPTLGAVKPTANGRVLLALGTTMLLWASSYAAIRAGLEDYGPGQVALLRLGVASVVLVVYALLTRMRLPDGRDLPAVFGLGFLRERLKPLGWIGMALSFVGAAGISLDEGEGFSLDTGALFVLISAFCVSIYFVLQKPYLRKYGALAFTTYAILAGTLFALVYLPGLLTQVGRSPASTTLAMIYLGIFPTAICYVTYAYAFSRMNVSVAASFLYLIPVLAYLIAWVWLGETPTLLSALGGIVVLSGVVIVNTHRR